MLVVQVHKSFARAQYDEARPTDLLFAVAEAEGCRCAIWRRAS